jgi:hypothetical protein
MAFVIAFQIFSGVSSAVMKYDIKILSLNYKVIDNKIEGNFVIINSSNTTYKDLFYKISILYKQSEGNINPINQSTTELVLTQNQTQNINFNHTIPVNALTGSYYIFLDIQNSTGINLAKKMSTFTLQKGGTGFLICDTKTIAIETKDGDVSPLSGPSFNPGEKPKLKFSMKNIGSISVNSKIKGKIYKRNITYNPTPVYDGTIQTVNFGVGEEKKLIIEIPSMSVPESYLVVVSFESDKNEVVSGEIEARFVVTGASAKILSHNISVENRNVFGGCDVVGPSDGSNLSDVKAVITLYDTKNKSEILKKEETINLNSNSVSLTFSKKINPDIKNINVKIEILHQNKILDSLEKEYTSNEVMIVSEGWYFTDISDYKFKTSINELALIGVLKGYPDNTFKPLKTITRAEFCTMVCYLIGKAQEAKELKLSGDVFIDLAGNNWASGFVKIAKDLNYVNGYPDKTFKPTKEITYAEAITVLVKALNNGQAFPGEEEWYDGNLKKAKELGISNDISFSPKNKASRGEIAHMLYKSLIIRNNK